MFSIFAELPVDHFARSVIVDTMLSAHSEERVKWINFFV